MFSCIEHFNNPLSIFHFQEPFHNCDILGSPKNLSVNQSLKNNFFVKNILIWTFLRNVKVL